jgi:hypothetical protein
VSTTAAILVEWLVTTFALIYIYAFFKLWLTYRIPVHQRYESIDPTDPVVPPAVLAAIEKRAGNLSSLGFRRCGLITHERPEGHAVYAVLHDLPDGSVTAIVLAAVRRGRQVPSTVVVNLATEFTDDSRVGTNDAAYNIPMPLTPRTEIHRFPKLADVSRLVAAHRTIIAAHGSPVRVRTPGSDPAGFFSARVDEEMQRQAGMGTVRPSGDRYRMTMRGAAFMVWRLAPPSSIVIRAMRMLAADHELRELGV